MQAGLAGGGEGGLAGQGGVGEEGGKAGRAGSWARCEQGESLLRAAQFVSFRPGIPLSFPLSVASKTRCQQTAAAVSMSLRSTECKAGVRFGEIGRERAREEEEERPLTSRPPFVSHPLSLSSALLSCPTTHPPQHTPVPTLSARSDAAEGDADRSALPSSPHPWHEAVFFSFFLVS